MEGRLWLPGLNDPIFRQTHSTQSICPNQCYLGLSKSGTGVFYTVYIIVLPNPPFLVSDVLHSFTSGP